MAEVEMLNQFVNQLAMCELLSAHNLLQPSLAFDCKQVEVFIQESYFDNNYNAVSYTHLTLPTNDQV